MTRQELRGNMLLSLESGGLFVYPSPSLNTISIPVLLHS